MLDHTSRAVVVDPDFGWGIRALAEMMPVHVVDSPANRPAIESIWDDRRRLRVERDVTVFRSVPGLAPEELLVTVLRSLRGALAPSDGQPTLTLRVVGVPLTPSTEAAMRALGLGPCRP